MLAELEKKSRGATGTLKNLWAPSFKKPPRPSSLAAPEAGPKKQGLLAQWFGVREQRELNAAVSFEEVLIGIMLWRLPWMVPSFMRRHRKARVNEVVYMMHALTIKDFFRTSVFHISSARRNVLRNPSHGVLAMRYPQDPRRLQHFELAGGGAGAEEGAGTGGSWGEGKKTTKQVEGSPHHCADDGRGRRRTVLPMIP